MNKFKSKLYNGLYLLKRKALYSKQIRVGILTIFQVLSSIWECGFKKNETFMIKFDLETKSTEIFGKKELL